MATIHDRPRCPRCGNVLEQYETAPFKCLHPTHPHYSEPGPLGMLQVVPEDATTTALVPQEGPSPEPEAPPPTP